MIHSLLSRSFLYCGSRFWALAVAPVITLAAMSAFAHPGHDGAGHGGFQAGLLHPMLGVDHLLAMLAIGLWSVRQQGSLRRYMPGLMLAGMWGGAALAWNGLALPGVETGIALSVLLAGVLVAMLTRLPGMLGGGLVAAFMLFHGHAHGSELPAGASLLTYLIGFSLATVAIAVVGKGFGALLQRCETRWVRALGTTIAAIGGAFALS
ncbi:urease accessory protein [Modicisalibacter xianhensis]|uniref:Urease accessory protein n=1 Tax=Modicisalibacter xianhensis TaxID=442341 RepID=A0A4R8G0R9_9GAMM|nr:HupE/UreJ family protein [Halomonas xianhensis]TDX32722.1 urease accessory protein [Halomonas xianhensis]